MSKFDGKPISILVDENEINNGADTAELQLYLMMQFIKLQEAIHYRLRDIENTIGGTRDKILETNHALQHVNQSLVDMRGLMNKDKEVQDKILLESQKSISEKMFKKKTNV